MTGLYHSKTGAMTIKELKEFLNSIPEKDELTGEDFEIFCTNPFNNQMYSIEKAWKLSQGDIILDSKSEIIDLFSDL